MSCKRAIYYVLPLNKMLDNHSLLLDATRGCRYRCHFAD
jgi:hypothetical protein